MNRANNLGVQIFIALMLMLVMGGCAPGSTGSGDGPSSASPPTTSAPASSLSLPVDTNNLPVGSSDLPIGQSFVLASIHGVWYDRNAGLILEVSTSLTTMLTTVVVKQSCYTFTTAGPWPNQMALAVQAFGSLTSTSAVLASGSYRVIIAQPSEQQIFLELLSQGNSTLIRSANLTRFVPTAASPVPLLGPC